MKCNRLQIKDRIQIYITVKWNTGNMLTV